MIGNVSAWTPDDEIRSTLSLQGGNIVGDTFSVDGATQQTGIAAADVFEDTQTITAGNPFIIAQSAEAGVLSDNGGPVQTIALKANDPSNPALDAASGPNIPADGCPRCGGL